MRLVVFVIAFAMGWLLTVPAANALVISEIHYHPAGPGDIGSRLEFVEIYNEEPDPRDVTGFYFADGISFVFPERTFIEGHSYLVVCADEELIRVRYGITNTIGDWNSATALDNGGERLTLVNEAGHEVVSVRYNDRGRWPAGADGAGHTLALLDPYTDPGESESWALSEEPGGTPGAPNFSEGPDDRAGVVFNEGLVWTRESPWVEVFNPTAEGVVLGGHFLTDDRNDLDKALIDRGTIVQPGAWHLFDAAALGLDLRVDGVIRDRAFVALVAPDGRRIVDAVTFRPVAPDAPEARVPDGDGPFVAAAVSTPAAMNRVDIESDIVINEIQYHPIHADPGREFIELYNRGARDIGLDGWRFDEGVNFAFSAGTTIRAGGYLAVARDVGLLRDIYGSEGAQLDVVGPNGTPESLASFGVLRNTGENVVLHDERGNEVDSVAYRDGGEWPRWADGDGSTLELIDPWQDNGSPQAWDASDDSEKAEVGTHEYSGRHNDGPSLPESTLQILNLDRGIVMIDDLHLPGPATTEVVVDQSLVALGDNWRILVGHEDPPESWRESAFEDSDWREVLAPVGYGESNLATTLSDVRFMALTIYLRNVFEIADASEIEALDAFQLDVEFDDGFVAYLNGVEVARNNVPGISPGRTTEATDRREPGEILSFNLNQRRDLLVVGTNVLAVQVHNRRIGDADMFFDGRLFSGRLENIPAGWNMVPSGEFEEELGDTWHMRGTHYDSGLSHESPLSGGGSFKLVASGSGDQKINRVETEIPFGLVAGTAYTVRFQSRWVIGSPTILTQGYNFGLSREHRLLVPEDLGTPGRENGVTHRQRLRAGDANLGPVVDSVTQTPALPAPGQAVTVSARVHDRDGVSSVLLHYALNSVESQFTSVAMTGPNGHGFYRATLPGQPDATRIIYEITAEDMGGHGGRFPLDHLNRTHPLVRDVDAATPVDRRWAIYGHSAFAQRSQRQQFHFWMHDENVDQVTDRGVHSDHYLRGSLVFEDRQIYQGAGFHFQGSALSRAPWASFRVRMPDDALLHGRVPRFNLDNDGTASYDRIVNYVLRNNAGGLPVPHNTSHSFSDFSFNERALGDRMYVELPGPSRLRKWYVGDDDGDLFEVDERYVFGTVGGAQSRKNARWQFPPYDNEGSATDPQSYRFYFSHRTNKGRDEWGSFMAAARFMDPGSTSSSGFDAAVFERLNVEEIVRVLSVRQNTGDFDSYGTLFGRSAYLYLPEIDGRWNYIIWDSDKSFSTDGRAVGTLPLPSSPSGTFEIREFAEMQRFFNRPPVKRIHYAVLKEMIDTHYNSEYLAPYLDRLAAMGAESRSVLIGRPGEWVDQRAELLRTWIDGSVFPQQRLEILTNGGNAFNVDADRVTLEGHAPAEVRYIAISRNGSQLTQQPDVVFSAADFFSWTLSGVPLVEGLNQIELMGIDFEGQVVDTDSIDVTTSLQGVGPFVRGDCNGDGVVDGSVTDAIAVLVLGFGGGSVACPAACDVDGNGSLEATTDALLLLRYNFLGETPPAQPFPDCVESILLSDLTLDCDPSGTCP